MLKFICDICGKPYEPEFEQQSVIISDYSDEPIEMKVLVQRRVIDEDDNCTYTVCQECYDRYDGNLKWKE